VVLIINKFINGKYKNKLIILGKQYEFPSDSDRYFLYNDIYPITKYLSFLEELKTLNENDEDDDGHI
jgi:hypothetical protein